MGHPPSDERLEFTNLELACGNGRFWHICKHCDRAYEASKQPTGTYALSEPKKMKGRIETFKSHLKHCPHFIAYVKARANANPLPGDDSARSTSNGSRFHADDVLSQVNPKRQKRIDEYFVGISEEEERNQLNRHLLEFQADSNLPESYVELKTLSRLLEFAQKMKAAVLPLPPRKTFGGAILDKYAGMCEDDDSSALRECQTKTQGRANFLSDVWQNIAREHLLGCQLVLFGFMLTYGLFATGSRHDGLAIAEQMENVIIKMQEDGWIIGAVVTDNAGQCGRARRILSLRWPAIAFVICFAHDLNNLVKAVLKSDYAVVTKQASDAVNALNGSSAKWLVEAQKCMTNIYGYKLNLKQLCETRWNSMHGCFASLLRVRGALELLAAEFRSSKDFPDDLRVFANDTFWGALADAEEVVRPLAYASLKLQRDENTMADVVVCYLDIFAGFSKRLHGTENLIREVEKRWRQCEQPLMLLALFLHPGHREAAKKLLNQSPLTTTGSLCRIGLYYFRRFNRKSEDRLYEDLHNWIKGEDDTILPFAGFSSLHNYWDCMQSDMPDSKLPMLAITILSIAVNTATCERYFSEQALIHTAKRNRLSPEKARKLALVRKRVRESDACGDRSKSSHLRRLTDPKERTRLRDRDDRFECNTNEEEEEETFVGPDGAFEYWRMVLCELEGDDDPPVALNDNDTYDTSPSQATAIAAAAAAEKERERFTEKVAQIKRQSLEPIPQADTREFPADNDRLFPQEKVLPGLRGQKVSLLELSNAKGLPLEPPGNYCLLFDTRADAFVRLTFRSHCSELLGWHLSSPQPIHRQR